MKKALQWQSYMSWKCWYTQTKNKNNQSLSCEAVIQEREDKEIKPNLPTFQKVIPTIPTQQQPLLVAWDGLVASILVSALQCPIPGTPCPHPWHSLPSSQGCRSSAPSLQQDRAGVQPWATLEQPAVPRLSSSQHRQGWSWPHQLWQGSAGRRAAEDPPSIPLCTLQSPRHCLHMQVFVQLLNITGNRLLRIPAPLAKAGDKPRLKRGWANPGLCQGCCASQIWRDAFPCPCWVPEVYLDTKTLPLLQRSETLLHREMQNPPNTYG